MNKLLSVILMSKMLPVTMSGVSMPSGLQTTINNLTTAGQILGGCLAGIFLVIAGIKFMHGSRESISDSKIRLACVIVGVVLCAGCSVIKLWLSSLMAF